MNVPQKLVLSLTLVERGLLQVMAFLDRCRVSLIKRLRSDSQASNGTQSCLQSCRDGVDLLFTGGRDPKLTKSIDSRIRKLITPEMRFSERYCCALNG